jgi:hypothetical protein
VRYWLNHDPEDPVAFCAQVKVVCDLYAEAAALLEAGVHVISSDEMTGIQALERAYPTTSVQMGQVERQAYEDIRHGTRSLIANWQVATGRLLTPSIGPTRNEADFGTHIAQTIASDPQAGWIFILDQLNTHKSETLVRLVDRLCDLKLDLGEKAKSGILQSMPSRAAFLSDPSHRIRFVYVPKHSSWLNQIDCWFSILVRRLIKRGNFTSTDDVQQQILDFIAYFNRTLAKPFNWKFKGFPEPD